MPFSWMTSAQPAINTPWFLPLTNGAPAAIRINRSGGTRSAFAIGSAASPVMRRVVTALPLSALVWIAILLLCLG